MNISKSRYLTFVSCVKRLWLTINKPELAKEDDVENNKQVRDGKIVGSYAKQYFENVVDVTSIKEDGELDFENMIGLTNRYLLDESKTIAEASFSVDNLFCSVDLLHPSKDGYDIYEVKATTHVKDEHYPDAAFQKYVLEQRGLKVHNVYILYLNNKYIRKGDIDVKQLFVADNITLDPKFVNAYFVIKDMIEEARKVLDSKKEPKVLLSSNCKECPFSEYCHKDVPTPSVLDIGGLNGRYDYYNNGVVSFKDVLTEGIKLNQRQRAQVDAHLSGREVILDKHIIKDFLKDIRYPVYHLDFETIELPIPPADGTWPYEQIPTQYSLHIQYEDGKLEHREFLGDSIDPRRAIAESLCREIPEDACVTAYHKSFECGRLKELAEAFEDLSDHLLKISGNIVDLEIPFRSGGYYMPAMGGRSSIKAVLPALYPYAPELDYHALPIVHNGGEAMDIYPKMFEVSQTEKEKIRDGLLKYCYLDTLAMVKVLNKLREAIEKEEK